MIEFLKRFVPYLKDYVFRFVQAWIGAILVAVCQGALAFLVKYIFDDVFYDPSPRVLMIVPPVVVLLYFLQGIGRYGQNYQLAWIGEDIVRRVRNQLQDHVLGLELAFFHSFRSGELISRITNDINRIRLAVSEQVAVLLRESLVIVALVGVVIYRSPQLAFWALVVIPLGVWPLVYLARRLRRISHRSQEKDSDISAHLAEVFNNVEIIAAHDTAELESHRFAQLSMDSRKINMKGVRTRELASPLMEFLGSIAVAVVIWVGGRQILEGHMTPGGFTSFGTALFMIGTPLKRLSVTYSRLADAVAASDRIFGMIDRSPKITSGGTKIQNQISEVEYQEVSLDYGEVQALREISFAARSGETIALVGDSGGGKTSLVSLLLRLYDPTAGRVLVNGHDLRELDLKSLRERIGIVTQRVYVFNDTIAANVAYGREIDRDRVSDVLKKAGAWDFVCSYDDGIDTKIDEYGANLSGGQRQRLAIARALYRNPDVLVLDEATSALDNRTEAVFQDALVEVIADKITFIIAHRLSTAEIADRTLVLSDGRIVGSGTTDELLETCPEYQRLVSGNGTG